MCNLTAILVNAACATTAQPTGTAATWTATIKRLTKLATRISLVQAKGNMRDVLQGHNAISAVPGAWTGNSGLNPRQPSMWPEWSRCFARCEECYARMALPL